MHSYIYLLCSNGISEGLGAHNDVIESCLESLNVHDDLLNEFKNALMITILPICAQCKLQPSQSRRIFAVSWGVSA